EAEVNEGVVGERGAHEDVAAVAAVSAGGSATGNEFFAAEGHAAVAAVAGFDSDVGFVDEHRAGWVLWDYFVRFCGLFLFGFAGYFCLVLWTIFVWFRGLSIDEFAGYFCL